MLYATMLYALKVGGCLAAFYLFFKLFMSRETLHRLNRVVVLSVLLLSFVLPFCVVTIREEVEPMPVVVEQPLAEVVQMPLPVEEAFPWHDLLGGLFMAGVVVMLLRVVASSVALGRLIARSPKEELQDGVVLVYADHPQTPFSWFGFVVVGEEDLQENSEAILAHERAHIRLGHSWDLLLFDLLATMQWFNPAMWLLRRELKAIHEYEADRAVLDGGADARAYQLLLIKKAAGERWYSVANSFNHSNLKNRITMMIQKRSSRWAAMKSLLLLPLVGVALGAFAETVYVVTDNKVTTKNETLQPADGGVLKLRFQDEKGAAMAGVTVVKKGTGEGVCSDLKGYAELNVKSGDQLFCSMIGKETIHYTVEQIPTEVLTLKMKSEPVEIDELVVVGYGAEEQAKPAADEEAVPFMLVDDERKKEIMAQHKREMEQAKADLETAKAELEAAKEEMEQAKADMEQAKAAADEEVFLIVEQMPTFEGGDINTFRQWVQMRVQYPKELQDAGVSGRVIVQFEVDTDGAMVNVRTVATPDKRLSDQVVALVKKAPKWTPGKQRGQAVKVLMIFPVEFKVSQPEEVTPNGVTPAVAEFAGGDYRRFEQWAQAKVQYPEAAKKEGVKGEVFVTLVVKANGEVGDVDVIGKADKRLAKEALRVVKSSPKWAPAKNRDGKAVAAKYGIKLRFEEA
ncbi:MAG: TonB family protein [Alistipes sp.]|nr:TonB family protein [Alistipes sp.]